MPTAVENSYVVAKLDELEPAARSAPGAPDDGRQRFDVRRGLGITAFGISAFSAPSGVVVINEHDETLLGEAGQEELYIVMNGAATFEIDGEAVEAPQARSSRCSRLRSGRRRRPRTAPRSSSSAGRGQGVRGSARGSWRGVRRVQRRGLRGSARQAARRGREAADNSVAHFNAGCFAARAGQADDAIEHLRRAVEINDRIKELIATDEDLDSIREDERFAELAK